MFLISIYDYIYNKNIFYIIRGKREMDLTKLWHAGYFFMQFCCRLLTFFLHNRLFPKKSFRTTIGVSYGLDPDQDQQLSVRTNILPIRSLI